MDQWGRGPVIMEERRDSVEEATLSKDAIVGAIAALAASAPVKNSCSISNSHSSEKVGPPPNYFSRSVQTKSVIRKAKSTTGSTSPLPAVQERRPVSFGRTSFKSSPPQFTTLLSSPSSAFKPPLTSYPSNATISESLSPTSTARSLTSHEDGSLTSREGGSPDRHRSDGGRGIFAGGNESDHGSLVGETTNNNGEHVGSISVVNMDKKPPKDAVQLKSTVSEQEVEVKGSLARTPMNRVLHLIGLHENTFGSSAGNVPPAPSSGAPVKDAGLQSEQDVGDEGTPQAWQYPVKPQAVQPQSTSQPRRASNTRRPAVRLGGIRSPRSSLDNVSNDGSALSITPNNRGVQFRNDSPRRLSSVISTASSPLRRESYNLHSGFNFSPDSPTPSQDSRYTVGVVDPSAAGKSIRRTSTHSRQSSLRSALSATSSRVHAAPPSVLPQLFPREDVPTAPGSDEDTDENSSEAGTPKAQRSDQPEGDVEDGRQPDLEGGKSPFGTVGVIGGNGRVIPGSISKESLERLGAIASEDSGLVLPCGPSDEEKVSYADTRRVFILSFGMLGFSTLSVGMWLYSLSSIYFWWYGVPSTFFTIYMCCQYFGVALWGKDFKLSEHARIVEEASERGFMPTVDVFLPVCNEPIPILANTWKYVSEMDYPHFKVFVLDDGAQDTVRDLAAVFGFEYVRRPNRPELKKAGNLRYTFSKTDGDYVFILDADFCPRADFLRETLPYFLDRTIGIVQTPQFFRYRSEQTWVERGAGVSQEFFYRLVQVNTDNFDASCCCGSCAVYRREALEPLGGMAAIEHSEDMYTGFKMSEFGYRLKFVPLVLAMGTCPDEQRSFFMQQYRWCMGTCSLVFKKEFWNANVSKLHKFCFFNGMMYYTATALLLFVGPLPILLLIWVRPEIVKFYHLAVVVPALLFTAIIIPAWSTQKYGMSSHRVRIIQCYAHLFAIKDNMLGTAAAWVPSGGGAKRSSSTAYNSSVWLLLIYNTLLTALIVGGSAWRMTQYSWYHFVPSLVMGIICYGLNLSTLWSC